MTGALIDADTEMFGESFVDRNVNRSCLQSGPGEAMIACKNEMISQFNAHSRWQGCRFGLE